MGLREQRAPRGRRGLRVLWAQRELRVRPGRRVRLGLRVSRASLGPTEPTVLMAPTGPPVRLGRRVSRATQAPTVLPVLPVLDEAVRRPLVLRA